MSVYSGIWSVVQGGELLVLGVLEICLLMGQVGMCGEIRIGWAIEVGACKSADVCIVDIAVGRNSLLLFLKMLLITAAVRSVVEGDQLKLLVC